MKIIEASIVTEPGAYRMPPAAYHGDPCPEPSLSNSLAQIFLDASPRHVWHAHPRLNPFHEPDAGTRRTALGSACHALLLGQGAEIDVLDFKDYRKDAAKEARDAAETAGRIPVLAADHERAQAIVASARQQLRGTELEGLAEGHGDAEVAVFANDGGTWTRALADWWSRDRATVVDFKTTIGLASAEAFAVQAGRMGYDFQKAWYERVIGSAFPELAGRLRFVFVVQEIEPPFALSALELSEGDSHVASRKVDAALAMWAECRARDQWPGYPRGVQRIQLPEWHTRKWLDREMEEGNSDSPQWQFAGGQ